MVGKFYLFLDLPKFTDLVLNDSPIGLPFIELLSVDSTNNYAMAMAHAGMAQHGTAVFAHEQTRGKGQRNKQWLATQNENIILSTIIEPAGLELTRFFHFSMAMAVAAYRFFNNYTGGDTKIKWPNDLYWRDRKAGGILIENVLQGTQWKYAVVGMGINMNQTDFSSLSNKAVSLRQITGKEYGTVALAKELCTYLEDALKQLKMAPDSIVAAYHEQLYKKGEWVKLKKGSRVFDAEVKGVTANGELVTRHATEELFAIGEVEWLL